MYVLYESYDDDIRTLKDIDINTKIIGVYTTQEQGVSAFEKLAEQTITKTDGENDWFRQEVSVALLENDNIVCACQMCNGGLDDFAELYTIILEKVEVLEND